MVFRNGLISPCTTIRRLSARTTYDARVERDGRTAHGAGPATTAGPVGGAPRVTQANLTTRLKTCRKTVAQNGVSPFCFGTGPGHAGGQLCGHENLNSGAFQGFRGARAGLGGTKGEGSPCP